MKKKKIKKHLRKEKKSLKKHCVLIFPKSLFFDEKFQIVQHWIEKKNDFPSMKPIFLVHIESETLK
jgi:hypothetical protein